ncbi:MAG: hypothetical protein GY846_01060 [Deltaproteobacteria bacterium]|nr:hypothetical protein [Deltaproteobacteria bacterium]
MKNVNVKALFLGPESENQRFFKKTINFMVDQARTLPCESFLFHCGL